MKQNLKAERSWLSFHLSVEKLKIKSDLRFINFFLAETKFQLLIYNDKKNVFDSAQKVCCSIRRGAFELLEMGMEENLNELQIE